MDKAGDNEELSVAMGQCGGAPRRVCELDGCGDQGPAACARESEPAGGKKEDQDSGDRGSRRKHIIEGRGGESEGSTHRSPAARITSLSDSADIIHCSQTHSPF